MGETARIRDGGEKFRLWRVDLGREKTSMAGIGRVVAQAWDFDPLQLSMESGARDGGSSAG